MSCIKYVVSDLHFSHKNMSIKRGFSSVEEHDELIIKKWNEVVTKGDIVYILGDITMEKRSPYVLLSRLKGIKYVALGNHDRRQDIPELLKYVNGVAACFGEKKCILTHIPIHPDEMTRFRRNIHGHLHDKRIWDERYRCVSLEQTDYAPIALDLLTN